MNLNFIVFIFGLGLKNLTSFSAIRHKIGNLGGEFLKYKSHLLAFVLSPALGD